LARVPGAIAALDLRSALVDGEMVVIDQEGRTSFSGLHEALKRNGAGLAFVAFDLLFDAGKDLRPLPLVERKARLQKLLGDQVPGPSRGSSSRSPSRR
jgi:bifunctional non-homologous end joining protein LigD